MRQLDEIVINIQLPTMLDGSAVALTLSQRIREPTWTSFQDPISIVSRNARYPLDEPDLGGRHPRQLIIKQYNVNYIKKEGQFVVFVCFKFRSKSKMVQG